MNRRENIGHPYIVSATISLYLVVPPPTIQLIPDINVTTGLNATFACKATGFGLIFSWEVPFSLTNNNGIVIGDNTSELTIVNVTRNANGEYTCNVTDFIGQTDIVMAELIVVGEFINYYRICVHYSYCGRNLYLSI